MKMQDAKKDKLTNMGTECIYVGRSPSEKGQDVMVRKSRQALPPSDNSAVDLTPKALTKQEFGRRLYALLMARNISQADLARLANMGRDSISTYVNGKTFPTPRALKKLADALGVEPEELLPNGLMSAMEDEFPAVELRQAAGHADKAWLRVNRAMSFATAAKIIALIDEEDNQ